MKNLNYNQLHSFYVIASEGSIKNACRKLNISQPALSGQLKSFEDSISFPLFVRKHRKLVLTENGREIFSRCERLFNIGNQLFDQLPDGANKLERNVLRIGAVSSFSDSILYEFTATVWKKENHRCEIRHSSLRELLRLVDDDKLDIVLSDTPYRRTSKYRVINLGNQKIIAVGNANFSEYKKKLPRALNGLPYISLLEGGFLQEEIDYFFKLNGIKLDRLGAVDDISFIVRAAEKGMCIAILPEAAVLESIQQKRLFKLTNFPELNSNFWVFTSIAGSKRLELRRVIHSFLNRKPRRKRQQSQP